MNLTQKMTTKAMETHRLPSSTSLTVCNIAVRDFLTHFMATLQRRALTNSNLSNSKPKTPSFMNT